MDVMVTCKVWNMKAIKNELNMYALETILMDYVSKHVCLVVNNKAF